MIWKSFELGKKDISVFKIFLVYGENTGLKREIINIIKKNYQEKKLNMMKQI